MKIKGFGLVSRCKTEKKLKRVAKFIVVLPIAFLLVIANGLKKKT